MGIFEVGKRELFLNEVKLKLCTYCTKCPVGTPNNLLIALPKLVKVYPTIPLSTFQAD
jgi:hypothetical protein